MTDKIRPRCTKCGKNVKYTAYYDGISGKVCERCFCRIKGIGLIEGIVYFNRSKQNIHELNPTVCDLFTSTEVDLIQDAVFKVDVLLDNLKRSNGTKNALKEFKEEIIGLNSNNPYKMEEVGRRLRAYLSEWKMYTEHWKRYIQDLDTTTNDQKYVNDFKDLFKRIMYKAYRDKEYLTAHILRNYCAHAGNPIDHFQILQGTKIFIHKSTLLKFLNDSLANKKNKKSQANFQKQINVIQKYPKEIDIEDIADKAMGYLYKMQNDLMGFQIDSEMVKACDILMKAKKRVEDAGINAEIWYVMKLATDDSWECRKKVNELSIVIPYDKKNNIHLPYSYVGIDWEVFSDISSVVKEIWNKKQSEL